MDEKQFEKNQPKYSDLDDDSLHRPRNLLDICIDVFILLAGALAYFLSIGVLVLLASDLMHVRLAGMKL